MAADVTSSRIESGLIVVNPTLARLRDADRRRRVLDEVQRAVQARTGGVPVVIAEDGPAAMRERVARSLEDEPGLVVVIGGDGTVRDVAELIGARAVPLAIVPAGTANLFAAALRIPLRPEEAARLIPSAVTRRVDLARVRFGTAGGDPVAERLFTVGAGIGFDAHVMAAASSGAKQRIGRYAYFTTAARELLRAAPVPLRVTVDGTELDVDAFEVLVTNSGELIPGLLRPALRIDPSDGLLDVFIVTGPGRLDALLGAAESIVRRGIGRSRSGRSYRLRARSVRVATGRAAPVEVDGDVVGSGWFEASSSPRALTVLVPGRERV